MKRKFIPTGVDPFFATFGISENDLRFGTDESLKTYKKTQEDSKKRVKSILS